MSRIYLGDSEYKKAEVFTPILLSAGYDNGCALGVDGDVTCWGGNEWGQSDVGKDEPGTEVEHEQDQEE